MKGNGQWILYAFLAAIAFAIAAASANAQKEALVKGSVTYDKGHVGKYVRQGARLVRLQRIEKHGPAVKAEYEDGAEGPDNTTGEITRKKTRKPRDSDVRKPGKKIPAKGYTTYFDG